MKYNIKGLRRRGRAKRTLLNELRRLLVAEFSRELNGEKALQVKEKAPFCLKDGFSEAKRRHPSSHARAHVIFKNYLHFCHYDHYRLNINRLERCRYVTEVTDISNFNISEAQKQQKNLQNRQKKAEYLVNPMQ